MRRAVVPGSYDPVTYGHVDIFKRAARLFDELIVAIGHNPSKAGASSRLFSVDERLELIRESVREVRNVRVESFTGLLTDYCTSIDAVALVKGVRGVTDFEYEMPMAGMNAHLTGVETIFIPTAAQWSFVSSSLVKEVASMGGDVSGLVPAHVAHALAEKVRP